MPARGTGEGGVMLGTVLDGVDLDGLRPHVRWAADLLLNLSSSVVITSARRTLLAQARAMATNVHARRDWVRRTYKPTPVSLAVAGAIDAHPDARSVEDIAAVILSVLDTRPDGHTISLHCAGLAFDLRPLPRPETQMSGLPEALLVKRVIKSLPHLDRFLEEEGGLVRWHLQFREVDV